MQWRSVLLGLVWINHFSWGLKEIEKKKIVHFPFNPIQSPRRPSVCVLALQVSGTWLSYCTAFGGFVLRTCGCGGDWLGVHRLIFWFAMYLKCASALGSSWYFRKLKLLWYGVCGCWRVATLYNYNRIIDRTFCGWRYLAIALVRVDHSD
jgi:hypothetical protein